MLSTFQINGEAVDSLDLKALIISQGVKVSGDIYKRFGATHRINPDPLTCNCLILPDGTTVQLTDLALHLRYLKMAIVMEALRNIRQVANLHTPFTLDVAANGRPVLSHNGKPVTEVDFPPVSTFYQQRTSSGLPFVDNTVLLGNDFVAFQCLWPCDLAKKGYACQYCFAGAKMQRLAKNNRPDAPTPTPQDVAEIVRFAVQQERSARGVQITGGSTLNTQAECRLIVEYLNEIDRVVGRKNIPGEILVFTTPPTDPTEVDQVFAAGADRIACSLEIWDESLANKIMPGKAKFIGRQRHLDTLTYIANKYGPNKACSVFIVGLEPAESLLEGAEFVAQRGIIPLTSVWIPFGRPVLGNSTPPGLDFYRRVKDGLTEIYRKYHIVLPVSCPCGVCSEAWEQPFVFRGF